MEKELQVCPTLAEFIAAVKFMRKKSAPGMTGLTYNMMSAWPDETIEFVYGNLASIWSQKIGPGLVEVEVACTDPQDARRHSSAGKSETAHAGGADAKGVDASDLGQNHQGMAKDEVSECGSARVH